MIAAGIETADVSAPAAARKKRRACPPPAAFTETMFSRHLACPVCDISYEEPR
jgi:hypothetical protein